MRRRCLSSTETGPKRSEKVQNHRKKYRKSCAETPLGLLSLAARSVHRRQQLILATAAHAREPWVLLGSLATLLVALGLPQQAIEIMRFGGLAWRKGHENINEMMMKCHMTCA